jgi:hypothetical protein
MTQSEGHLREHRIKLSTLVREILDGTELTDPTEITDELLQRLTPSDLETVFGMLLRAYVVDVMRAHRSAPGEHRSSATGRPVGTPAETRADRSRALWRSELFARYYVPDEESYALLGDLTAGQHRAIAEHRRQLAQANRQAAQWHALIARALRDNSVVRTADLPADVLDELLKARPAS